MIGWWARDFLSDPNGQDDRSRRSSWDVGARARTLGVLVLLNFPSSRNYDPLLVIPSRSGSLRRSPFHGQKREAGCSHFFLFGRLGKLNCPDRQCSPWHPSGKSPASSRHLLTNFLPSAFCCARSITLAPFGKTSSNVSIREWTMDKH